MIKFDILYKNKKIYQDLDHEQCCEILEELSSQCYDNNDFDIYEIQLEEINYGNT